MNKKLWLIVIFLFLSACSQGDNSATYDVVLETASLAQEKPTLTGTSTPQPSPTKLETLTLTLTPTMAPLPTFLPEEKLQIVEDLFLTNAGCQLPCWWGFNPGMTEWEEVRTQLQTFAFRFEDWYEVNDIRSIGVDIRVPEHIYPDDFNGLIKNRYFVDDMGIVDTIQISFPLVSPFPMQQFLQDYGLPKEVYIQTFPEALGGFVDFSIFLLYPEKGILIIYHDFGSEEEKYVQGCFGNEQPETLIVWDSKRESSFQSIITKMAGIGLQWGFVYSLEEITNLSIKDFYNIFSVSSSYNCIEVSKTIFKK